MEEKNVENFRKESKAYFDKLERFFWLFRDEDNRDSYNLFAKEMSEKWEKSLGHFFRKKAPVETGTRLQSNFLDACQFQMNLLRNWTAHNLIEKKLSEDTLAYFFMIALRSWVFLDFDKIYYYEHILSTLFDSVTNEKFKSFFSQDIERSLNDSFYELLGEIKEKKELIQSNAPFLDLVKKYGALPELLTGKSRERMKSEIQFESSHLMFQSFWHGLFPAIVKKSPKNQELEPMSFDMEPIPEGAFPEHLGHLILKKSFTV